MARKSTYRIDGDNNLFATLREAKHHIYVAYTAREAVKYLTGAVIACVRGEHVHTLTPIMVSDEGRVSYGRTRKL